MKHKITLLSLAMLLFLCAPGLRAAAEDSPVLSTDFEDGQSLWAGTAAVDVEKYEGNYSGEVLPSGSDTRTIEYSKKVFLQSGVLYELSYYVINASAEGSSFPKSSVLLPSGSVLAETRNISSSWRAVKLVFTVEKSDTYGIAIKICAGADDLVFIDNIKLGKSSQVAKTIALEGLRNIYIPDAGSAAYSYRSVVLDESGGIISGYTGSLAVRGSIPDGVEFNPDSGELIVSSETPEGSVLTLTAIGPKNSPLSAKSFSVVFNKNMIENGDFESFPFLYNWDASYSPVSLFTEDDGNRCATVNSVESEDGSTYAEIKCEQTFALEEGVLYVLRAKVRSTDEYPSSYAYAQNSTISSDYSLEVNIMDIGGGTWTKVYSAFRPKATGIYDIKLKLHTSDERPVFIDDLQLCKETPAPETLTLSAPGNIALSDETLFLPFHCAVKNQEGEEIPDESVDLSISPEDGGVLLDTSSNMIVVPHNADPGDYTITGVSSSNPNISSSITFTVSEDFIGDGSFENKLPGQWWAVLPPSRFSIMKATDSIKPTDKSKLARISMYDNTAFFINNSYASYKPGVSYLLSFDGFKTISDVDTGITVFIDNVLTPTIDFDTPVAQFLLSGKWNREKTAFSVAGEITGRMFFAISLPEGYTEQVLYLDNIRVMEAVVDAKDVKIEGSCRAGETVYGSYKFVTNTGGEDASISRWYIGDEKDGQFEPIGKPNQKSLALTSEMVGRYIRFDVIPACSSLGLAGEVKSSAPVLVEPKIISDGEGSDEEDEKEPKDGPVPEGEPEKVLLEPVTLAEGGRYISFNDTYEHWARDDIAIMSASGIANGTGNNLFAPNKTITRAEFTAFLVRSFNITPVKYTSIFTDVSASDWYASAVATAYKYGMVAGVGDGRFDPNANITREEIALMVMRAYEKAGGEEPVSVEVRFSDSELIHDWAKKSVTQAYTLGIVRGFETNTFAPQRSATRAEAVVMLRRMLMLLNK